MSEIETLNITPLRAMVTTQEILRVDRFIGYDKGMRDGARRRRENASPEFIVRIDTRFDEAITNAEDYNATIVENAIPFGAYDTSKIMPGTPVAVAEIAVEDEHYYALIMTPVTSVRGSGLKNERILEMSERVIQYEGDPKDLLSRPDLFVDESED